MRVPAQLQTSQITGRVAGIVARFSEPKASPPKVMTPNAIGSQNRATLLAPRMLILLLAFTGCTTQTQQADTETATGVVTVEFKTDEKTNVVLVEGIADGETVESVMRKIGDVDVSISGSGTTAFVEKIGEKTTANGEGWTYTVNGQRAERGIGATTLSPPATVTWEYGEF